MDLCLKTDKHHHMQFSCRRGLLVMLQPTLCCYQCRIMQGIQNTCVQDAHQQGSRLYQQQQYRLNSFHHTKPVQPREP